MIERTCLYLLACLVLTACHHQPAADDEWQPELLLSTDQCRVQQPGAEWFADTANLTELIGREAEPMLALLGNGELTLPAGGLLLVAAGIQPNPGYGLEFLESGLMMEQAVLKLNWKTPDPDLVYAMVRVSPCLLFGLPDAEVGELLVLDQLDKERYRLSLQ